MIEVLTIINIGIAFMVLLATSMLQHHFKRIERYSEIYADKKVYKGETEIRFISLLIAKYHEISGHINQKADVSIMVSKAFYNEKVGCFKYIAVQSTAIKGRMIMWILLVIQVGIELAVQAPIHTKVDFIMIITNALLCMIITLFGVIKSIPEERDKLLIKLADYIVNTYPAELEWQKQQQGMKELQSKVEELQQELANYQTCGALNVAPTDVNKGENPDKLKEKDIINLLGKFNLTN